jgi:3-isopropylmalate/(R)-2-methylmalate dehydratase small subunit
MEKFTVLEGVAAPLKMINVDTDMIIPKQYLKTIKRTGLGSGLFAEKRYRDDGSENPDFVLNKPAYRTAKILVAGDNFGCGSSREHAPWALTQFGFKAVVSTSFADIFKGNSLKNGLLPIVVPAHIHAALLESPGAIVKIDLASETLTLPDGTAVQFPIDAFSKHCLLEGVDELGYILKQDAAISAYEARRIGSINTLA